MGGRGAQDQAAYTQLQSVPNFTHAFPSGHAIPAPHAKVPVVQGTSVGAHWQPPPKA
jgi:hypothetical protein